MKKLLPIFMILLALLSPTLAAAQPQPAALAAVAPWPQKADWVGQQAVIYPAKLYATASYLLVFPQPGQSITGADQLYFARKFIRQSLTIGGLYKLAKPAGEEFYWRLNGAGGTTVWVKDSPTGLLAVLPFALNSELAAENKAVADLNALVGTTFWLDRNVIDTAELSAPVGHLSKITVTAFKSSGPFSDTYSLAFTREDGSPAVWATATTGTGKQMVYGNGQFLARAQKGLLRESPRTRFPQWNEDQWTLIEGREIRTGWDQDMVTVSWGAPETTEKLLEGPDKGLVRWRYGGTNLFFRGKQLAKIRIPDPALAKLKPAKDDDRKTAKNNDKKKDPNEGLIEVSAASKEPPPAAAKDAGKPSGDDGEKPGSK